MFISNFLGKSFNKNKKKFVKCYNKRVFTPKQSVSQMSKCKMDSHLEQLRHINNHPKRLVSKYF